MCNGLIGFEYLSHFNFPFSIVDAAIKNENKIELLLTHCIKDRSNFYANDSVSSFQ